MGWYYLNMVQWFSTHFILFHYLYVMQSVYELNLFPHNNNTCHNNQCCPLQSSLLGTLCCGPVIVALFEPFCTAHHLTWAIVWWLCLNCDEISKSPLPSWIGEKPSWTQKKNSGMFFTYEPMCLVFFGCGYGGLLHWFLGHTIKLTSYLCDESYGALSGSCQRFWHMLT